MLSGSYMLYGKHPAALILRSLKPFAMKPPMSRGGWIILRCDLRPQLKTLDQQIERNERYVAVEQDLRDTPGLTVVERPEDEFYVGSSIQFLLLDWRSGVERVLKACFDRGVELKWFGATEPQGLHPAMTVGGMPVHIAATKRSYFGGDYGHAFATDVFSGRLQIDRPHHS